MLYTLHVNKQVYQVEADPQMPALWVIRDLLKLKGTKFGCGAGYCGACTIHLNGQAVRSCSLPVSAVGEAGITTIEGLSSDGSHPLQKAWETHNVPQCGYCQAGQIMTAAAFLDTHPKPGKEEIIAAMNGNLCRCGTYSSIVKAITTAAGQSNQ